MEKTTIASIVGIVSSLVYIASLFGFSISPQITHGAIIIGVLAASIGLYFAPDKVKKVIDEASDIAKNITNTIDIQKQDKDKDKK
ncbi:MAG: hypothetical protein QXI16_00265 [Sulfolobaceae archaeon]